MKPVLTGQTRDLCWFPLLMGLFYGKLEVKKRVRKPEPLNRLIWCTFNIGFTIL